MGYASPFTVNFRDDRGNTTSADAAIQITP